MPRRRADGTPEIAVFVDDVVVAMLLRRVGETGVQAHVQTYVDGRRTLGRSTTVVTPFDAPRGLYLPMFALRRIIERLSSSAGVWWYREVHGAVLTYALWRTLRSGRPTVIYVQDPVSAAAALRARRNERQRVVMALHFNLSQADEWADKGQIRRDGRYFGRIRRFEAATLPRLDGLMCVSQFSFDQIAERIPTVTAVPTTVIPNGVTDPGAPAAAGPEPKSRLITIGSVEPRKNHRYAIEIVAASRRAGGTLTLTIVGDGPERSALEALCGRLGVSDAVEFAGFRHNAADMIPGHDAYLHTATMESFGIVLVEAMSRQVPVFATKVGGVVDVFTDGVEGRFIPSDDADAAAAIIIAVLDDQHQRSQMAKAARATFLERFEAGPVTERIDEFLASVAAR